MLPVSITAVLRVESAVVLVLALILYAGTGASWWLFAALILLPDLAMLGYLRGPRVGAATYNAAHTYLAPAAVWTIGLGAGWALATPLALIWAAHVAGDRMIGYGLKDVSAFKLTHLSPRPPS